MKTIQLPALDHSGTLSPHVIQAMLDGATSANDPSSRDHILLTFRTAKDAQAFAKLVGVLAEPEDDAKVEDRTPAGE